MLLSQNALLTTSSPSPNGLWKARQVISFISELSEINLLRFDFRLGCSFSIAISVWFFQKICFTSLWNSQMAFGFRWSWKCSLVILRHRYDTTWFCIRTTFGVEIFFPFVSLAVVSEDSSHRYSNGCEATYETILHNWGLQNHFNSEHSRRK